MPMLKTEAFQAIFSDWIGWCTYVYAVISCEAHFVACY